MAGIDNEIIFGQGLDLSGNLLVENQLDEDGKIYIGSTTGNPQATVPTSTDDILSIVPGDGTLDLQAGSLIKGGNPGQVLTSNGVGFLPTFQTITVGDLPWTLVTSTSQNMSVANGYVPNNVAQVNLTLPTSAAFGEIIKVQGKGSGGYRISQNAGQMIVLGKSQSTLGITGYIESTHQRDAVELLCTEANIEFTISDSVGNLTFV